MNQSFRFPVSHSTLASIAVLFLAVSLTLLSMTIQGFEQVNGGNLCSAHQDEPCLVSVPAAGWPLPYLIDHLGTSAMGVLGLEDLRIGVFLLDFLFYALLLSGIRWLLSRRGPPDLASL